MGYLSCNAESAISTCDSYNFSKKKPKLSKIRNFSFADLETATNGFSETNFLGKGSHGSVYRAVLGNGELIAAVKLHRYTEPKQNTPTNISATPADNEIETLSQIQNSRLVNLLGFCSNQKTKTILTITEYMPNGSLFDLLHKNNTKLPSLAKRIKIAIQIAKAVHYLHTSNPPVIHRDIKSSNILFDEKWNARLGDFGLALRGNVEDVKVSCTPPAGTLGYLDPCYLAPGDLSAKNDVFSFGILLLEIFSGRNAIDLRFSPPSVVDWAVPLIKSGDYGEIFDGCLGVDGGDTAVRQLAVLAARCVVSKAEKRPGMAEVVACLKSARKRISSVSWRRVVSTHAPFREYDYAPALVKYEALTESNETVKVCKSSSKRNRKLSSVICGEMGDCHVARSKSIGCVSDLKDKPLDRSKSTGELGYRRRNGGGIVLQMIRNPNIREFESSKLLVKFS
uniref:serine/threonine-protein kinase-like protein At3g51990 n=1 Tax=Erigeron canadensis TaxID=72917 RepID=UPI001CB9542F|nr:serine/threonine-protein kinase-like protein At3g51990 [Erigeron canadensis]